MNIKIEHIENLTRGKKSGSKIGSRATPHRLKLYEREIYELALKNKYLELYKKDRINLLNIWEKVCISKGWDNLFLSKDLGKGIVYKNNQELFSGDLKEAKKYIRNLILD